MDTNIETSVALIQQQMTAMKDDISEIKLAVIGDTKGSTPGLVRQMDAIKSAIAYNNPKSIDERVKTLESYFKLLFVFLAPIAVQAALWVWNFFLSVVSHVKP